MNLLNRLSTKIGMGQVNGKSMALYERIYSILNVVLKPYYGSKHLISRLRRGIAYFKQGFNTFDFDDYYLLEDIVFKLERMRNCISKGYNEEAYLIVAELNYAIDLGKKVMDYDYEEEAGVEHKLKWGILKHTTAPCKDNPYLYSYEATWENAKTEEEEDQANKEFLKYMKKAEDNRRTDEYKFFNFIADNHNKWWD